MYHIPTRHGISPSYASGPPRRARAGILCIAATLIATLASAAAAPRGVIYAAGPVYREAESYVAWGVPLASGPIRALMLAPRDAARDVAELALRIELEPRTVLLPPRGDQDLRSELDQALTKRTEVIVTSDAALASLPPAFQERVFEAVRGGVGLVFTAYDEPLPESVLKFIAETTPIEDNAPVVHGAGGGLTPEWADNMAFVRLGQIGEGRLVELDLGGPPPRSSFLSPPLANRMLAEEVHHDTYLSLAARAVRWAAGHDPAVRIAAVVHDQPPMPDESQIPPDLPERFVENVRETAAETRYRSFTIRLAEPAPEPLHVRSQVRQPGRRWIDEHPNRLPKGAESYPIMFAAGPGQYSLDIWLTDGKDRVVEWHTEDIELDGWPRLADVRFAKGSLYPNDALDITAVVEMPLRGGAPALLYARASDPLGRSVAEAWTRAAEGGGSTMLRLGFSDLISQSVVVEVYALSDQGRPPSEWDLHHGDYRFQHFPVHLGGVSDRFRTVVRAGGSAEYNARLALRDLARRGVDMAYTVANEESGFYLTRAGIRPVYEIARWTPDVILNDVVRTPSFSDAAWRRAEFSRIQETVAGIWATESALFSLGDGACVAAEPKNACQGNDTLEAFREMLALRYGDVDALNAVWNTQFTAWEDVIPAPEEAAAALDAMPAWLAFRRFMDGQFTAMQATGSEVIRNVRPQAQVGFAALPGEHPYLGYDWEQLTQATSALAVPPEPYTIELVRAALPDATFAGLCTWRDPNANATPDRQRWYPWYAALHGLDSVWMDIDPPATPDADADAHPTLEAVRALNDGPAALLQRAARVNGGIAIYDNQASRYASYALRRRDPSRPDARAIITDLLEGAGHAYDIVGPEQARKGDLKAYRLVILADAVALDDDEADAIRALHAAGGHVLSLLEPGLYTADGLPRTQPALRDLLPDAASAPAAGPAGEAETDGTPWRVRTQADAKAIAPNPAWLAEAQSAPDAAVDALAELLAGLGLRPTATVAMRGGDPFPGECIAFRYGKATLYALLRDPRASGDESKPDVRIAAWFDGADRLFDVRAGVPVRRPSRVRMDLPPGDAALFASLPYTVTTIDLAAPAQVHGGERLTFEARIKTEPELPGDHVLLVDLAPGVQDPLPHYTRTVVAREGRASDYIPLARNERLGAYRLRVRDVLTGTTVEQSVEIAAVQRDAR